MQILVSMGEGDDTFYSFDPTTYSSWLGGFTGADISGAILEETRMNLMAMDPPGLPCLTVLGINERIVHIEAIKRRMATWPGAEFDLIPDAEHELMMEVPVVRNRFFDKAAALFDAHR